MSGKVLYLDAHGAKKTWGPAAVQTVHSITDGESQCAPNGRVAWGPDVKRRRDSRGAGQSDACEVLSVVLSSLQCRNVALNTTYICPVTQAFRFAIGSGKWGQRGSKGLLVKTFVVRVLLLDFQNSKFTEEGCHNLRQNVEPHWIVLLRSLRIEHI